MLRAVWARLGPRLRFLQLAEGRILVEQLRLVYGNVGSSVLPSIVLALLLVWTLANDSNRGHLLLWCAAVLSLKLFAALDAKHRLSRKIPLNQARSLAVWLVFLHGADGAAWSALAWVSLDTTTVAGSIMVMAVAAGVVGNSMSLLSPVLPVFVSFTVVMFVVMATKLWSLGDPAYSALGLASVLYAASLLGQASNSARAARAAIELRFENVDLIEQAQAARREAENANLAKSKFLAAASHDLRQPIHAQGLFLDVLGGSALSPYQSEVLASARSASRASSEMLNTLLDFSRVEAGVVEPLVRPFGLQVLLNKIENDLAPLADAKGIVYRARETAFSVNSDATLVEMILRNLVSNAVRYTEHGGVLTACRRRGDTVVVEIWDTGIGIAPAHQREVFREFHQLGNTERDRQKGLGLGLAIADGLARALGHGLVLSSVPGKGSVFKLVLPWAATSVIADAPFPSPGMDRLKGLHALVIDDDESVRLGMSYLLRSWGCSCITADSISEACTLAAVRTPDVILSDYRLRDQRTGAQAIATLRDLLEANIPAVMVTGDTAPERLREALASGVLLLHKPVATEHLYRALVGVLDEARDLKLAQAGGWRAGFEWSK